MTALIRNPEQEAAQAQDEDLEQRISAVTESLQLLEVGVAESGVMLSLAAHFDMMESERSLSKMEMRRVMLVAKMAYKAFVRCVPHFHVL